MKVNAFLFVVLMAAWTLSLCLGCAGVFIAAKVVGGWSETQSLFWMLAVLIGLLTPMVILLNKNNISGK